MATCAKRGQKYDLCQARENMRPVPSAGKHATDAKRGKTCDLCETRGPYMIYLTLKTWYLVISDLFKISKRSKDFGTNHAVIFSCQVTTLLNRERQLLQERKLVNREFERLKLEKSRPGSNRIREPPQRLSDLLNTASAGAAVRESAVRLDLMSPRDDGGYSRELDDIGSRTFFNGISKDRVIL